MTTIRQLREVKILKHIHKDNHSELVGLGKSKEVITSSYTPLSCSSVNNKNGNKYDVTFAKPNYMAGGDDLDHRTVFVHHEGRHVGSIEGFLKGKEFTTNMTGLNTTHQGSGVMADVYHSLLEHHGLTLRSASHQSIGGHKLWQNLATKKNVQVDNLDVTDDPSVTITAHLKEGK